MNVTESHYPKNRQQFRSLLKSRDINPTSQRLALAEILLSCPQHQTAEQVISQLNAQGSNVSKATVYNTLNLFATKGLLKQLIIDGNRVFFDSNTSEHHHFFNEETSELIDFSSDDLQISQLPDVPPGTKCTGVDVFIKIKKA